MYDPYEIAATRLWDLLDTIDTLSDVLKPERSPFYEAVMRLAEKRHGILKSNGYDLMPVTDLCSIPCSVPPAPGPELPPESAPADDHEDPLTLEFDLLDEEEDDFEDVGNWQ